MTWCARCDVTTAGPAGDTCPSCGEPTFDTSPPSSRRTRAATQVLEVEQAPAVEIVETVRETAAPEALAARRFPTLPVLRGRSRILALTLVLALGAGAFAALRSDSPALPAARPLASTTPSTSPTPEALPPLGQAHSGSLVVLLGDGFKLTDLATGTEKQITVGEDIFQFAPSSRGGRIAYINHSRFLKVVGADMDAPITIGTEVNSFSWTADGAALIVVRQQLDSRDRTRTRLEQASTEGEAVLLLETYAAADGVISRGGSHLVTVYGDPEPSVYEVLHGKLRLVRRGATLLDVSPDGRHALVSSPGTPRLVIVDIRTLEAKRVGQDAFLAGSARFSPDGRSVAVLGTPNYTMEKACDRVASVEQCPAYPYPIDQSLWSLDTKTLELRSLIPWSSPEHATSPAWGPGGWLLLLVGEDVTAVSMTDRSRPNIVIPQSGENGWSVPAYLP